MVNKYAWKWFFSPWNVFKADEEDYFPPKLTSGCIFIVILGWTIWAAEFKAELILDCKNDDGPALADARFWMFLCKMS